MRRASPGAWSWINKLVPHPVDRQDVARLTSAVADLGTELCNVGVDGARRGIALVPPHVLEQLVAAHGLALALDQVAQQLELARAELQQHAVLRRLVGLEVEVDVREAVARQPLGLAVGAPQ